MPADVRLTLQTLGGARLFGPPGANGGRPLLDGGKPVALIAYLAATPARQARRDQLVDLLWSDLEPDAAKHALRQTIWYVKKRVGEGVVVATADTLSVTDALVIDRDTLLDAASRNDHDGVLTAYTGDFLPDFAAPGGADFEAWADVERRRLRSLYFRAAEASVRELLGRGRTREALARARRARDVDPSMQAGWRLVLETLVAAQEWTQAQVEGDAFERVAAREEFGLEPSSRALLRLARQGATEVPASATHGHGVSAELIGREREFAVLLEAATHAQRGRGEHLHVRAGAGLGKSRLLGDVAARLRSTRARVVLTRCELGSRELPYAAASDVALALGRLPGARGISPESASVLVAMAPALSTFFSGDADWSGGGEALRRRAQALAELASAVGDEQALVLLVDDVHWMDAESRTVLGQLATRAPTMRLVLVTAGRPVIEGRLDAPESRTLELTALSDAQCGELLQSIASLGSAEWGPTFVHELWRATAGSPLHLMETLQLLRERDLLVVADSEWRAPAPDALFATLREGGALVRRLEALPREPRWILTLLAVAGSPVPERRLGVAVGRDLSGRDELADLERRGFVARADAGWGIAHDEIGMTVLERASADSVRAAHAALGRAMWQDTPDELSTMRRAGQHLALGEERAPLHALFGIFVRRLRALGDARPNAILAEEMLGRHARIEVVRDMVAALPWHVRIGLTTPRRIAVVAAGLVALALLPTTVLMLRASAPPPPQPAAELVVVGTGAAGEPAVRVPIYAGDWIPGRAIPVSGPVDRYVVDPWVSWPVAENPAHPGSWFFSRGAPGDADIEVFSTGPGGMRRLTTADGDDLFGSVAPDGARVVVSTARWNQDSHYDLAVIDVATGAAHTVTRGDDSDEYPRWSPLGDRIAFGRRDWHDDSYHLCIVNPDGSDLECPEVWAGVRSVVGWTGDERILAARPTARGLELVVADVRERSLSPLGLVVPSQPELSPDGRWLVCQCERLGYDPGTWFVMPLGRASEARPLALPPLRRGVRLVFTNTGRLLPISALRIDVGHSSPVVGVPHLLTARGVVGDRLTERLSRVRWASDAPEVLRVDSTTGIATPRRPGRVTVRATLPGWRAATRTIDVRAEVPHALATETWGAGWEARWYDFGTPRPVIVQLAGRPALNMNGDGKYTSGVVTRTSLDVSHGLAVDAEIGVRITKPQWQVVHFLISGSIDVASLSRADRDAGVLPRSDVGRTECGVSLPAGEGVTRMGTLLVSAGGEERDVPLPPGAADGRLVRVRLQLFPDGRCGVAIDGRAVFLGQRRLDYTRRATIELSGNAHETHAVVGRLEVWAGMRPGVNWDSVHADSARTPDGR